MKKIGAIFYNAEALSNIGPQDLFDPVKIFVYILDKFEATICRPPAKRISTGKYFVNIDETMFIDNEPYEILWVYDLHTGSPQVLRNQFTYNSNPSPINNMCRIYGNITTDLPISGVRIECSVLKDGYSTAFVSYTQKTISDAFGDWNIFLPQGKTIQIILPILNDRKFFIVPASDSAEYDTLTSLTTSVVVDRFGNPV